MYESIQIRANSTLYRSVLTERAVALYDFEHEFLKAQGPLSHCLKEMPGKDGDPDGSETCAGLVNRLTRLDFAEMLLRRGFTCASEASARFRPYRVKVSKTLQLSLASLMLKWSRCLGGSALSTDGSATTPASRSLLRNCTDPVLAGCFSCFDKPYAGVR